MAITKDDLRRLAADVCTARDDLESGDVDGCLAALDAIGSRLESLAERASRDPGTGRALDELRHLRFDRGRSARDVDDAIDRVERQLTGRGG